MDTGSKSLAQLSEEGKEKKFISIEVGSKVSGYTKDYLERLCRLNKVEYRLRDTGAFAIELESLLNETHTILLSYEGVTFIEKSELTLPEKPESGKILSSALKEINAVSVATMPEDVNTGGDETKNHFAQPVPRFGDMNHLSQQVFGGNPFSFVGRTVVSDGKNPDVTSEKETHIPIGGGAANSVPQKISIAQQETKMNIPVQSDTESVPSVIIPHAFPVSEKSEEIIPAVTTPPVPLHIPISVSRDIVEPSSVVAAEIPHVPMSVPHKPTESIKLAVTRDVTPEKGVVDDWDALLFSSHHPIADAEPSKEDTVEAVIVAVPASMPEKSVEATVPTPVTPTEIIAPAQTPSVSGFDIASPYRPFRTSVDATQHHEGGDLFPEISKSPLGAISSKIEKSEAPSSFVPQGGQKVIVFDPQSLIHASEVSVLKEAPAAPKMIIPRAVPMDAGAQSITPPSTPVVPLAPLLAVTPVVALGGTLEKQIIPKVPLSTMRVMPQIPAVAVSALPGTPQEHRVLIREDHPLLASRGLNVVFGLFIGATSLLLLGGMTVGNLGFKLNSASYVAGVGNIDQPINVADTSAAHTPSPEVLPFSNELIVSSSTTSNSVQVTPVFEDGEGTTYQYDLVGQRDVSASTIPPVAP